MSHSMQSAFARARTPSQFIFGAQPVRVILIDGEPWFVAKDVCATLGYRDAEKGTRNLGTHQKRVHPIGVPPSGNQRVTIINESGLHRLVLRSRKPEAAAFSDWVTGEVLPAIRKTGGYGAAAEPSIDVRALMLSGQSDPATPLPPDVVEAIEAKAWQMARDAYVLSVEHLRRRVEHRAACGHPVRQIDRQRALAAIQDGALGDALAHEWARKVSGLRLGIDMYLALAKDLSAAMDAMPHYRPSGARLLAAGAGEEAAC